jgi:hypothetical protein
MRRKVKGNSFRSGAAIQLLFLLAAAPTLYAQNHLRSKDAYVQREGDEWVVGTSAVEKRVRLAGGRFSSLSLRNKISGQEYQDGNNPYDEIRFSAGGQDVSGLTWQWTLGSDHISTGNQGELQLDIELISASIRVTKHYVVYPGTAVIREWMTLDNSSTKPVQISRVEFLHSRLLTSLAPDLQFNYLTGGGNYNGSQLLKSEPVSSNYRRTLDSNGGIQPGNYSSYLPLIFLLNRNAHEGLAVGWDYLGHWRFAIGDQEGFPTGFRLELAGFEKDLAPGAQIETPKIFMAPFSGGVDELGNQLLDWQYGYLWEFTNSEYFAKTRWAVDWPDPWVGEGGTPSADNWGRRLALDLRYVDLARETGTDILWDDAGWYDKWGTWNGPEWRRTNDYLRKHGMRWVLWYPTFLATAESKVAQQHPDWMIPGQEVLEQSISATADWQSQLLNEGVSTWGDFQWRYDIAPAASANDTDALAADQNFRNLLQRFKSDHPQSGIDACDGGGRWISYDIARLAESGEYTDGGVGPYSSYYTALLVPPDKLHNVVDFDHTYYDPATDRTHLAMNPTWYRDPGDGPDVEAIRKDWEIYHYLVAQGVAGRWSHVFRPAVDHDDAIWYFQRMNRDSSKGVIIAKHVKHGATYFVISRLSKPSPDLTDQYRGGAGEMNTVTTTSAASIDTGLYEDPVDGTVRFYGVPGQGFGPLNVKYQSSADDESLVTSIVKIGADRRVGDHFFGMELQVDEPMIVTQLGQFDPGNNHGTYTLSLVRADDGKVLGTVELDMSPIHPDAMGFKYARLRQPIRLEASSKPVVIYPRGLSPAEIYDVRASASGLQLHQTGSQLMTSGVSLDKVAAGELIFLNLPHYPGSGTDHVPPSTPTEVKKRLGTNLGAEGIELTWSPSQDDNWISYYEIKKNGTPIGRSAKGTFFFDHSSSARKDIDAGFEVVAVDGDGNRSPAATAQKVAGEPAIYEALGDFSPTQSGGQWTYEEAAQDGLYRDLIWDKGGYEGRWTGSGLGRIGRIWMQPSAQYDLSRTFTVPAAGVVSSSGIVRKDPSAENRSSCFVRILQNSRQVWPAEGWAEVSPNYSIPTSYQITDLRVSAGDKIRFIVKHNGQNRADPIVWDPAIVILSTESTSRSDSRYLGCLPKASSAAPIRSRPPRNVSVDPPNPIRKCCGCSKNSPGTTLVSNCSRSIWTYSGVRPILSRGKTVVPRRLSSQSSSGRPARNALTSARFFSSKPRARSRTRSRLSSAIIARSSAGCTGLP